jgi:tetratricopeptide (TPR) repeat protein
VGKLSSAGYVVAQVPPDQRVALLRSHLTSVAEELDVFHFGVRLLQLGRYADALVLLERFRARFAGREVLNDVGLAHLQIALGFLGGCDPAQYLRFKLPLVVDPQTRASATVPVDSVPLLRAPGAASLNCAASARFVGPWTEAERSLRLARDADPSYVPAYENLTTALLVAGQGTKALTEINTARELDPGNRALTLQRGVALYLMGKENGVDATDQAVAWLRDLEATNPNSSDVVYDIARILTERSRAANATQAWRRFLALEPRGAFAVEAARNLPDPPSPAAEDAVPALRRLPTSPVPLGGAVASIITPKTTVQTLREGSFRGSILRKDGIRALAIDDVVEVVDVKTQSTASPLDVYGVPLRTESGLGGDLHFYPGLMVEWSAGRPRTEVFFQVASQLSANVRVRGRQ